MSVIKELYDGQVLLRFSEGTHRYDVSVDGGKTWDIKQGVTTTLGKVLAKPALLLWPLNEAMKSLGAKMVCTDQEKQIWEWTLDSEVVVNTIKIQAAATAHRKKSDTGKSTGHETHALIENYLRSIGGLQEGAMTAEFSPQSLKAFNAFQKWYESQTSISIIEVERILFSRKYDIAGTTDAILKIDGKTVLTDWKTTNASRDAPLGIYSEAYLQLGAYAQAYIEETGLKLDDLAIGNASKTGEFNIIYASELGLSVEDCIKAWLRVLGTFRFLQPLAKQLKEKKE